MKLKANQKGFTLVELLIVIVVIAILAAISIVAYSGIQNRAKTTTGQELAAQIEKKAVAHYTVAGTYPAEYSDFGSGDATESALEGVESTQISTSSTALTKSTAKNGTVIRYVPCETSGEQTGANIYYFDYNNGSEADSKTVGKC